MKLYDDDRTVTSISFFQLRKRPPPPGLWGETRKLFSSLSQLNFDATVSSVFFVSDRKVMSGEFLLWISLRRWTVCGFPRPQQFQLTMTKEPEAEETENPIYS